MYARRSSYKFRSSARRSSRSRVSSVARKALFAARRATKIAVKSSKLGAPTRVLDRYPSLASTYNIFGPVGVNQTEIPGVCFTKTYFVPNVQRSFYLSKGEGPMQRRGSVVYLKGVRIYGSMANSSTETGMVRFMLLKGSAESIVVGTNLGVLNPSGLVEAQPAVVEGEQSDTFGSTSGQQQAWTTQALAAPTANEALLAADLSRLRSSIISLVENQSLEFPYQARSPGVDSTTTRINTQVITANNVPFTDWTAYVEAGGHLVHFDGFIGSPTSLNLRQSNLADGFSVQLSVGTDAASPWDSPVGTTIPREPTGAAVLGLSNFCGKYGWMLPWPSGNILVDCPGINLARPYPTISGAFPAGTFSWAQATGVQNQDPGTPLVHFRYREGVNSASSVEAQSTMPLSYRSTASLAGSYGTFFYDTNVLSSQVNTSPGAGVPAISNIDVSVNGFPFAEQVRRKGMKTKPPRPIRTSERPCVELKRRTDIYVGPARQKAITTEPNPVKVKGFSRYMKINRYVRFDSEEAFSARQQYILMAVGPSLTNRVAFSCAWDFVDVD